MTTARRACSKGTPVVVAVVFLALLGGCGDATSRSAAATTVESVGSVAAAPPSSVAAIAEAAPVLPVTLTDDTGTTMTVTSVDRIIPVDGDLAEIVFALGLGDRVVATDLSATYPPEADAKPQIGYQRALSPEPIAAFEPTIVLATDLAKPVEIIEQLRAVRIPVVVIDRKDSIDGPADKIRAVAAALGVPRRGEALIATMQADVDTAIARGAAATDHPRVLVLYVRGANTQLIFGKGSGVDIFLPAVGAVDVSAELGIGETEQITAEALVKAEPDVIICSTTGLASVGGIDGLLAIQGIAQTPAGRNRRVLTYEDQFLFGGGPRYGQLLLQLVTDLHRPTETPST